MLSNQAGEIETPLTHQEKSCLPVTPRFVKSLVHLNEKAGRPLGFDHHHPVAPVIKKVIKEAAKENWLINLSFSNHACSNADQFVISFVWVCILLDFRQIFRIGGSS